MSRVGSQASLWGVTISGIGSPVSPATIQAWPPIRSARPPRRRFQPVVQAAPFMCISLPEPVRLTPAVVEPGCFRDRTG